MASIRIKRLEKELFRLISNVVTFKLRDKKLSFVSISDIKLSNDLSQCKIYFTHMSDYSHDVVQKALIKTSGFIKKEIAAKKFMRSIPELVFIYDKETEKARNLDEIFAQIREESSSKNDEEEGKDSDSNSEEISVSDSSNSVS